MTVTVMLVVVVVVVVLMVVLMMVLASHMRRVRMGGQVILVMPHPTRR